MNPTTFELLVLTGLLAVVALLVRINGQLTELVYEAGRTDAGRHEETQRLRSLRDDTR
jgi:hypothetical protein